MRPHLAECVPIRTRSEGVVEWLGYLSLYGKDNSVALHLGYLWYLSDSRTEMGYGGHDRKGRTNQRHPPQTERSPSGHSNRMEAPGSKELSSSSIRDTHKRLVVGSVDFDGSIGYVECLWQFGHGGDARGFECEMSSGSAVGIE